MNKIGIIGAGAWGTALATAACRAGREVTIWARETEAVSAINETHENTTFLPGIALDPAISATSDLAHAASADALVLVTPAQYLRATAEALKSHLRPGLPLIVCAKGVEIETGALMNEIVETVLPGHPLAVLSGPTFAAEVARELPTAITLACENIETGKLLVTALSTPRFRIYRSEDVIGAEVGGAVKNVLAIACGIVEGRGYGDNARAAIITRGLAEMARLSTAKGGRPETLMGLSGIGDLTLTCNAMQSRNYSLGVALGGGRALDEILGERQSVAEGVDTAVAITDLAGQLNIDMPICHGVDSIVNHGGEIDATVNALLARPVGTDSPLDKQS